MTVTLEDKKTIQRNRKMRYFINASDKIISQEGLDALTIRRVADDAGFNSATLYNYFENLDHLVFYSYIHHVLKLERSLRNLMDTEQEMHQLVRKVWYEYCDYVYKYTDAMHVLLFSSSSERFSEVLEDYSGVFPEDFQNARYERISRMFEGSLINPLIVSLSRFGMSRELSPHEITNMQGMVKTYFQGLSVMQKERKQELGYGEYRNQISEFINRMIKAYT